jgi:cytochrome c-type biogenesis protein CcmH
MALVRRARLFAWLLALLLAAGAAQAQDGGPQGTPGPVSDDEVNRVAKMLYCPVCENVPLDVCPTQACAQWRGTIREKLEQGWSDQQILDYFVAQYGERVLARPSTRGINVLVWVIPPVLVLAGAFVLWRFLGAQTRPAAARPGRAAPPPAPSAPGGDEYAERLEAELRKRI